MLRFTWRLIAALLWCMVVAAPAMAQGQQPSTSTVMLDADPPRPFRFVSLGDGTYAWNVTAVVRGALIDRSGAITTANVSQAAVPINQTRHYLLVQNTSAADLWVSFGGAAVVGQPSMKVAPGATLLWNIVVPDEGMNIIGPTANSTYTCKEG